jgi:hypothetical protein
MRGPSRPDLTNPFTIVTFIRSFPVRCTCCRASPCNLVWHGNQSYTCKWLHRMGTAEQTFPPSIFVHSVLERERKRCCMISSHMCQPGLPDGFFSNTKVPIWVNFGGPEIEKCCYMYIMAVRNILQSFGIFYDHLVHFVFMWYIFSSLGITCTKKNLATLVPAGSIRRMYSWAQFFWVQSGWETAWMESVL